MESKLFRIGIIVLTGLALFVSCVGKEVKADSVSPEENSIDTVLVENTKSVRMSVVGDIMMHRYQMNKAYIEKSDSFEFEPIFRYVQDYFDESDLLVGNLETVFAGKNKGRMKNIHGYGCFPFFNAPDCFASHLKSVGFDLLVTANNHSLDSYPEGAISTIHLLDSLGIAHFGTYQSDEDKRRLCIVERNGIKFGFTGYTYSLNGLRLPKDQQYLVNEFVGHDKDKIGEMCDEVRRLKEAGVDMAVAFIHAGEEYQKNPNPRQKMLVDSLRGAGCSLVLISHPHILQKVDYVPAKGNLGSCFVAYSLGNFISGQVTSDGKAKDIGVILELDIEKNADSTYINQVSLIPTYSYWRKDHIGVMPVIKAYEQDSLYSLNEKDRRTVKEAYTNTLNVLRGDMDTSLWKIEDGRYQLHWDSLIVTRSSNN